MKQTYQITGMTCNGCVASVTKKLTSVEGVQNVSINLEKGSAEISMANFIPLNLFKSVLPKKYTINEKKINSLKDNSVAPVATSKLQQLKPLLLIFLYLFVATFLLNYMAWNIAEAMLDFMGLFYIVFSFFKLLDLKGFPESFRMYDPLAERVPLYGKIYPFIEVALGLLFLMRVEITFALVATIVVLGITTIGVAKTLLDKKNIRCACLGTALKLPMTEATIIENFIMLVMAISMLIIQITKTI